MKASSSAVWTLSCLGTLGESGAATAYALTHQRQIMLRCMNGRGYKVVG